MLRTFSALPERTPSSLPPTPHRPPQPRPYGELLKRWVNTSRQNHHLAGLAGVEDNGNSSAGVMTGSRTCGEIDSSLSQANERFPFHLMPTPIDSIVMRPKEQVGCRCWVPYSGPPIWSKLSRVSLMLAADPSLPLVAIALWRVERLPRVNGTGLHLVYVSFSNYRTIHTERGHGEGNQSPGVPGNPSLNIVKCVAFRMGFLLDKHPSQSTPCRLVLGWGKGCIRRLGLACWCLWTESEVR